MIERESRVYMVSRLTYVSLFLSAGDSRGAIQFPPGFYTVADASFLALPCQINAQLCSSCVHNVIQTLLSKIDVVQDEL